MALTKVSTPAIKDEAITLAKLLHGDSNSNGKFLRANNGADPSFEAIDLSSKFSKAGGDTITGDFTIASGTTNKNINIDVSDRIRFDDNLQATFGNSDDLKIYHTSNDNYLDLNSGTLKIRLTSGADFIELQQDRDVWIKGEPKPWDNNTYSLGRSDYKWSAVHATTYYGDGSNLTGLTSTNISGNSNNRIITGSDTADTLNGEADVTYDSATSDFSILGSKPGTSMDLIVQNNGGGNAAGARITIQSGSASNTGPQFGMICGSKTWYLQTPKNVGALDFHGNGTRTFRLLEDGHVEIADGDLTIGTNGHGIDFYGGSGAYRQAANTLDDYEEGTWTPDFDAPNQSSTTFAINRQHGYYTKIGNIVHVACYIQGYTNSNDGGGSNDGVVITGLPFTVAPLPSTSNIRHAASFAVGSRYRVICDDLLCHAFGNSTVAKLFEPSSGNTMTQLKSNDITPRGGTNEILFSGSYRVA